MSEQKKYLFIESGSKQDTYPVDTYPVDTYLMDTLSGYFKCHGYLVAIIAMGPTF